VRPLRRVTSCFFESGLPHAVLSANLMNDGIEIGRLFRPYDRWARVSIGLPDENALARDAVEKVLRRPRS